jgi:parallel beta-helix repeat protein
LLVISERRNIRGEIYRRLGEVSSMRRISVFVVLVLLFGFMCLTSEDLLTLTESKMVDQSIPAQTLSDPIVITQNDDFASLGFLGAGTPSNPYRIENLHFKLNATFWTRTAIAISNTNKSFEISNCIFDGFIEDFGDWSDVAGVGVKMILAQNGEVSNCVFDTLSQGVSFEGSENMVVSECSFSSNFSMLSDQGDEGMVTEYSGAAIKIDSFDEGSSNIAVLDCSMQNFGFGVVTAGGSNNISIMYNAVANCSAGIHPQNSHTLVISNNTCLFSVYEGIAFQQTHSANVTWNNCSFNRRVGIWLDDSSSNNIIENNIVESNGNLTANATIVLAQEVVLAGIWIDNGSSGNQIESHDLIDNKVNALNDVSGNTYDYNYYSDYSGIDANGDSIGDTPHSIPGDAPTQDNHPRMTRLVFDSPQEQPTGTTTPSTSPESPTGQDLPDITMYLAMAGGFVIVLVVGVVILKRK